MANLTDLASADLWDQMIHNGYIRVQTSPNSDLKIFNYSQTAQFEKAWNAATLASRGIITDLENEIVARPFGKFFNLGELSEREMAALNGRVIISDKLDGSLGISYTDPSTGAMRVATRGSFTSDQALIASNMLAEKYTDWAPLEGQTYLWEIIYPGNRIVLDYKGYSGLMLIGRVDNETGVSAPLNEIHEWPWDRAEVFNYTSLSEAVQSEDRANAEGLVAHFVETDARVKIKQEDYVRLHRVMTGVTVLRVWEVLKNGDDLREWLEGVPDEVFSQVKSVADRIQAEQDSLIASGKALHEKAIAELGEQADRGQFARFAKENSNDRVVLSIFFAILSGRADDELPGYTWQSLRPTGDTPLL